MKSPAALLALGIAIGLAAQAATAGIPVTRQMTCPIGGERFAFTTTGSYTIWGERPDGRPYGSWHFPLDLPECPSNRLILYKEEFGEAELVRLEALIARPEYRALADEAQYYRLHWLMREMGGPPVEHLRALVQAVWQADEPARRGRYLEELATGMAALPEPSFRGEFAMRGRWINALRELGRFDEAAALLARTPLDRLQQPAADAEDGEQKAAWLAYFDLLHRLIERRDARAEPLDAIPVQAAVVHCVEHPDRLTEADRAVCARESEAVERLRRSRDER